MATFTFKYQYNDNKKKRKEMHIYITEINITMYIMYIQYTYIYFLIPYTLIPIYKLSEYCSMVDKRFIQMKMKRNEVNLSLIHHSL